MSQFTRVSVDSFPGDNGVKVKSILSLIKGHIYEQEIYDCLSVKQFEGDVISISGASTLVKRIEEAKKKYTKLDVLSEFSDITFTADLNNSQNRNESIFQLLFSSKRVITYPNPDDVSQATRNIIEAEDISAEPAYDAQTQLFSKLFNFERYANALLEAGVVPIVKTNLDLLQAYYRGGQFNHRYRLLKQNDNGKYFFRAIISADRYKDYNIGVSVFIALISMHQVMKKHQSNYIIKDFSYTESLVSVFFENTKGKKIKGLGEVRFQVMLSNSEITSGAVKLSGLFTILVKVDGQIVALDAKKPEDNTRFKDTIVSISHGSGPEVAINKMDIHESLKQVEERIYKEVELINTTRDVAVLKNIFMDRLNHSRAIVGSDATKAELSKVLNEQANTFNDLLQIMGRAQVIVEKEGVESKQLLKYIVYSVLTGTGRGPTTTGTAAP